MKKTLEKKLARLTSKKSTLAERAQASNDANEVRMINAELMDLNEEIEEVRSMIASLEADEKRAEAPANAEHVNPLAHFEEKKSEDKFGSMEYRSAFKAYAQNGTPIPAEYRSDDRITSGDIGAVIPTTVMNEIISNLRGVYGNLYAKVRKMNVKGGVKFPIASLSASMTWVAEDDQKSDRLAAGTASNYVSFSYNLAEIRVAQSLVAAITSIDAFEAEIVKLITEAFLKAMDTAIVNGTGSGQPLGITADQRVTNVVTFNANTIGDWKAWRTNFFALLPKGKRQGNFIFPISTVETHLLTMADSNNRPVYYEATGLVYNDKGEIKDDGDKFYGRTVDLVEPGIIGDFDSADAGDVIGIYWQPEQYAINSNLEFGIRRYFDEETNEYIDKALVVCDGKVLDPSGFYLIKKAAVESAEADG